MFAIAEPSVQWNCFYVSASVAGYEYCILLFWFRLVCWSVCYFTIHEPGFQSYCTGF